MAYRYLEVLLEKTSVHKFLGQTLVLRCKKWFVLVGVSSKIDPYRKQNIFCTRRVEITSSFESKFSELF